VSSAQLSLTAPGPVLEEIELVDGQLAEISILSPPPPPVPAGMADRNLFGEAERIAGRAASASTRRQYAAIFRSFGDWLAGELGRAPVVGDLDADVIAAYGRARQARAPTRAGVLLVQPTAQCSQSQHWAATHHRATGLECSHRPVQRERRAAQQTACRCATPPTSALS
jgi:hypothetical protein